MGSFLAGPPVSAAGEDIVMRKSKMFGGTSSVLQVVANSGRDLGQVQHTNASSSLFKESKKGGLEVSNRHTGLVAPHRLPRQAALLLKAGARHGTPPHAPIRLVRSTLPTTINLRPTVSIYISPSSFAPIASNRQRSHKQQYTALSPHSQ
jgi:hypothetical protein